MSREERRKQSRKRLLGWYCNVGVIVSWMLDDTFSRTEFLNWYKTNQPNREKANAITEGSIIEHLENMYDVCKSQVTWLNEHKR